MLRAVASYFRPKTIQFHLQVSRRPGTRQKFADLKQEACEAEECERDRSSRYRFSAPRSYCCYTGSGTHRAAARQAGNDFQSIVRAHRCRFLEGSDFATHSQDLKVDEDLAIQRPVPEGR